jgi:hypothetical protein
MIIVLTNFTWNHHLYFSSFELIINFGTIERTTQHVFWLLILYKMRKNYNCQVFVGSILLGK